MVRGTSNHGFFFGGALGASRGCGGWKHVDEKSFLNTRIAEQRQCSGELWADGLGARRKMDAEALYYHGRRNGTRRIRRRCVELGCKGEEWRQWNATVCGWLRSAHGHEVLKVSLCVAGTFEVFNERKLPAALMWKIETVQFGIYSPFSLHPVLHQKCFKVHFKPTQPSSPF